MTSRFFFLVLLLAAGGCDRQGIEPIRPGLTVESPDLGEILAQPELTLRVRATGSSQIETVRIGGLDAERTGDAYTATFNVTRGLTAIALEAFDADGEQLVADTAYALFVDPATVQRPPPAGLESSGALSVTPLSNDRVLVAGGEPPRGDAVAPAVLLRAFGENLLVERTTDLRDARYNHSATLLPDGTVLLLGGATRRVPRTRSEFVTTAERVTPGAPESVNVLLVGAPPLRSGHVTRMIEVDGEIILFLVGGVVPGEPPVPSRSVDVLRYIPGAAPRLVVLTPTGGAGDLPELPDPILLDLSGSADGNARSFLFGLGPDDPVASQLRWSPPGPPDYPVGLDVSSAPSLLIGRTRAASASLPGGLFLVSGGQDDSGKTLGSIEAVVPAAGRAFAFAAAAGLGRARSGHAATSLGPGRMLVLGGYNEAGFAILEPEITTL